MKTRGFTLAELLGVIVILSLIVAITVPVMSNIIKDSKSEVVNRSIDNYVKSLDQSLMQNNLDDGKTVEDGIYTINNSGDVCLDSICTKKIVVKAKGTKPSSGSVRISDNKVVQMSNIYLNNNYYDYNNGTISVGGE